MGCGPTKLGYGGAGEADGAIVKLCRERKEFLKSAADHRFSLAAAHAAYFLQLREVGESLCRFVEEELVLLSSSNSASSPSSPSSLSSPVLILPSDHPKLKTNKKNHQQPHRHRRGDGGGGGKDKEKEHDGSSSHLHWSSSGSGDGHLDIDDEDDDDTEASKRNDRGNVEEYPKSRGVASGGSGSGGGGNSYTPQPGIQYVPDPDPMPNLYYYPPGGGGGGSGDSFSYSDPYYNPQVNYGNDGNFPDSRFNYYSNYPGMYSNFNGNYNNDNVYDYGGSNPTYTTYYMKKSATRIPTVIYEEPKYVNNHIYSYNYPSGGNVGGGGGSSGRVEQRKEVRPPTPPSPKVSAWDYFNPFESYEGGGGYFVNNSGGSGSLPAAQMPAFGYGYESNSSSPDSREVREREGIPDLEEETETEVSFQATKKKVVPQKERKAKTVHFHDHVHNIPFKSNNVDSSNTSHSTAGFDEGGSGKMPFVGPEPVAEVSDEKGGSPDSETSVVTVSTIDDEEDEEGHGHEHEHEHEHEHVSVKKKGVSFEVESSNGGGGSSSHGHLSSSKPSSLTTLSAHGTRDLKEVVREIKDEFEAATDYGKEVSVLLEVGKEPYRSRTTFLKALLAKVCSTSLASAHSPSNLAAGYPEEEFDSRSLASTLDKLYVWEKKLHNEVKDEERLRVMYEKQCKKLKTLDERGAESHKVEATEILIKELQTKLNVSMKRVDSISSRIHKLRDEELQPQLKELIYGLRKMWKLMLKCHQKQFHAILESKTRALRANTGLRGDSSVRATIQLEAELLKWGHRFDNWVEMHRSYANTLNGWLQRCIHYEPEDTPDGVMPYSPGRIGAPPVFVICHDWKQAMERVSESEVQTAMSDFATSLHQLWERQDEEQRRRVKAENMYKDFEKQIRAIRIDRQRKGHEHDDAFSDKNSHSMVASESGISPLDDLKVDLDSMRQKVRQERAGHKEAVKLVHDAVSRTIQAGLVPIFESLENFTSEASKAFDDVRLENVGASA